ncbi:MAG: DoxX family protein [Cyclobacteriaceae bacterium]
MKKDKIIYWITTVILCIFMTLQGFLFTFIPEQAIPIFETVGAPTWLVLPLGIAKLLAVIAILTNLVPLLAKLAYYGLAVNFIAAIVMSLLVGDPGWIGASVAMVILFFSMKYGQKVRS